MLVTPARSRGIRYACVGIYRYDGDPATRQRTPASGKRIGTL